MIITTGNVNFLFLKDAIKRMETTLSRAQSDVQKFKGLADQANALVIERMKQELTWENVPEVRKKLTLFYQNL